MTLLIPIILLPLILIYKHLLYPAFISPLTNLPHAHFTTRFSNLWMKWHRYHGQANITIHHAHKTLGPIIRLGSTEVSVNTPDALRRVYSDICDRDEWYSRVFQNYGIQNMFSYTKRKPHAARKRIVASLYSKSTLYSSPEIMIISRILVKERVLSILDKGARDKSPVDVLELGLSFAMDFICAYLFGIECIPDFLRCETSRREWLGAHRRTKGYGVWSEFPGLVSLLRRVGVKIIPDSVVESGERVRKLCLDLMERVETRIESGTHTRTKPVVYEQLTRQLLQSLESHSPERSQEKGHDYLIVASELMDHIKAGTETSGWSLTYVLHELSGHPDIQAEMRSELQSIPELALSSSLGMTATTLKALDSIPLLDGIILETLRLHPAVAGSQPRVTSESTVSVLGWCIPPRTRISAQAYSLHRNEEVFPDPETWDPYRWVRASSAERVDMMKWLWAFGSGGRMCVGNWFALLELKLALAGIYFNFHSWVVDDEGVEQDDGYSAGPVGKSIFLGFGRA